MMKQPELTIREKNILTSMLIAYEEWVIAQPTNEWRPSVKAMGISEARKLVRTLRGDDD